MLWGGFFGIGQCPHRVVSCTRDFGIVPNTMYRYRSFNSVQQPALTLADISVLAPVKPSCHVLQSWASISRTS